MPSPSLSLSPHVHILVNRKEEGTTKKLKSLYFVPLKMVYGICPLDENVATFLATRKAREYSLAIFMKTRTDTGENLAPLA